MELIKTEFEGLVELVPKVFPDERGEFLEVYNSKTFSELGLNMNFVQDNMSFSKKGVVRGMHFQKKPFEQGKLVSVAKGKALDVVIDLRKSSPMFGKYKTFILDSEKRNIVYVPEGFAHGFLALEETILTYKCTSFYNKEADGGVYWNDPDIGIEWGIENPIVSEKDQRLPSFRSLNFD